MKEIPISKRIPAPFISKSKHVQYVSFSHREEQTLLDFLLIWRNRYCMNCLCIPSRPLFLPTPNSRHYPRSFSKPLVWTTDWPLPSSAWPCPSHAPLLEASLAAFLPVIYLQEQHSSGAGLDQMAVISPTEAQRWELWPILWSATRSNRCRSEWINGWCSTPMCRVSGSRSARAGPAAETFKGNILSGFSQPILQ